MSLQFQNNNAKIPLLQLRTISLHQEDLIKFGVLHVKGAFLCKNMPLHFGYKPLKLRDKEFPPGPNLAHLAF